MLNSIVIVLDGVVPQTQDSRSTDRSIPQEAQASFKRLLASDTFSRAPRLRSVLKFFIDSLLDGTGEEIHEQSIARAVFGRPAGYSQSDDNIVRVNVRLLRVRLEEYYRTEGWNDTWLIAIPKGRYVPEIINRPPRTAPNAADGQHLHAETVLPPAGKTRSVHWLWLVLVGCISLGGLSVLLYLRHEQPVAPTGQMASTVPFASFPRQAITPA
jgi:hypothetical protein